MTIEILLNVANIIIELTLLIATVKLQAPSCYIYESKDFVLPVHSVSI